MELKFTADQQKAWTLLTETNDNIFLTGFAGSGKSFLVNQFIEQAGYEIPVLASTGAAALLVRGRTFHSFFCLGAMQERDELIIQKALSNRKLISRLRACTTIIIDEISMLNGRALNVANQIAQQVCDADEPWGGIRIIAVGDFAQLPPIAFNGAARDWAFESESWLASNFKCVLLREIVRTSDLRFLHALHAVRNGTIDGKTTSFLNNQKCDELELQNSNCLRLFSRKAEVEQFNLKMLAKLETPEYRFKTTYHGEKDWDLKAIRKDAPVPETLVLKVGAYVMIRKNCQHQTYANGSTGYVREIEEKSIRVEMEHSQQVIKFGLHEFEKFDADCKTVARAIQFPINLAWACTIHKSQGMSLDKAIVDLRALWEPGQAYVALSRLKTSEGLRLYGWYPRSIITDSKVMKFYSEIEAQA